MLILKFSILPIITFLPAPVSILLGSMHRIKAISAKMLAEKMADSGVSTSDMDTKRDIMSLLVKARITDTEESYKMSDKAMMDQVVRQNFL